MPKFYSLILMLLMLSVSTCAVASDNTHAENEKLDDYPTGSMSKNELLSHEKFFKHHESQVSEEDVALLKAIDKQVIITTYFGLWCHDSKREVPRLLDLLAAAENKNIIHRLIALDIEKKEPFGRQEEEHVKYTPTFIVKINDKEVGRIVERPENSLAEDIVSFLSN